MKLVWFGCCCLGVDLTKTQKSTIILQWKPTCGHLAHPFLDINQVGHRPNIGYANKPLLSPYHLLPSQHFVHSPTYPTTHLLHTRAHIHTSSGQTMPRLVLFAPRRPSSHMHVFQLVSNFSRVSKCEIQKRHLVDLANKRKV